MPLVYDNTARHRQTSTTPRPDPEGRRNADRPATCPVSEAGSGSAPPGTAPLRLGGRGFGGGPLALGGLSAGIGLAPGRRGALAAGFQDQSDGPGRGGPLVELTDAKRDVDKP
ncbi:hypothetical protein ACIRYZ_43975 [Kitasatospora sp. NPDC101155]|uniref:hypothetical protein n=1 Tax=Kitasatospora sp. NPDC101155 TaxID=3364097 RepID=UPI00380699FA